MLTNPTTSSALQRSIVFALLEINRLEALQAAATSTHASDAARLLIASALAESGDIDHAVPALLALIRDEEARLDYRMAAVELTGKHGGTTYLKRLAKEPGLNLRIRVRVAAILGESGDEPAISFLVSVAQLSHDPQRIRLRSIAELRRLERWRELALLFQRITHPPLREALAEALIEGPEPASAEDALLALANAPQGHPATTVAAARQLALRHRPAALRALAVVARDSAVYAWVRVEAISVLHELGAVDELRVLAGIGNEEVWLRWVAATRWAELTGSVEAEDLRLQLAGQPDAPPWATSISSR
jgi:hypothetical protein